MVRHLEIRYHLVRCIILSGDIVLAYCITEEMLVDLFTKIVTSTQDKRLVVRFYNDCVVDHRLDLMEIHAQISDMVSRKDCISFILDCSYIFFLHSIFDFYISISKRIMYSYMFTYQTSLTVCVSRGMREYHQHALYISMYFRISLVYSMI